MRSEIVLGLPDYEISEIQLKSGEIRISARYAGPKLCPHCGKDELRNKGRYQRQVGHEDWGLRHCVLELKACKWQCKSCERYFRERFPGILPCQRSSEAFQKMIYRDHLDGINRSRLSRREGIGAATVERYFRRGLQRQFGEWHGSRCPPVLGIDEHFFTRRSGYATTLCDLKNHKIYDVILGRSELALEAYFQRLEGKAEVRVVCMDLASNYRSLIRLHFPQARIVADRFHVIRIINHHFLACWREIDDAGSRNRGLLSLMRRASPPSSNRSAASPSGLSGRASGAGDHLPLQTAALLSLAQKTSHPQTVRATGAAFSTGRLPVAPCRPGATGPARPDSGGLVGRNRRHVALHPQNHRRLSQQNGAHQPTSLRLPELRKL